MDGPRTPEGEDAWQALWAVGQHSGPSHCSYPTLISWLGSCNRTALRTLPLAISWHFRSSGLGLPVLVLRSTAFPEFHRLAERADDCGESLVEPSSSRAHPGLVCHAFLFLPAWGPLNISNLTDSQRNRLLSIGFDGTKALQSYELLTHQTSPPTCY